MKDYGPKWRAVSVATCTAPIVIAVLALGPALAEDADTVNTGYFGNLAILGYDPVAYFTESAAVEGSPDYSYDWLGATWQFANEEHREMFIAEPIRFAPQYGGYCTLGTVFGERSANVDPETWRIVDGRLYLFAGAEGLEHDFDPVAGEMVAQADSNWAAQTAD